MKKQEKSNNMENLRMPKEQIVNIYKNATSETKEVLNNIFGTDYLTLTIIDEIKTYEDACGGLGINPIDECAYRILNFRHNDINYFKLAQIARALNEGWTPKANETIWYPIFNLQILIEDNNKSQSFFEYSENACFMNLINNPLSLCFRTRELSDYCANQFEDLWRSFLTEI